MATVDEVMAQALAIEQFAEEEWTKVYSYEIKTQYTDTDVAIDVRKREIGDVRENVSTIDENNAQYISFIMDRYCDGVDLTGMRIQIQYQVSEGVGSTDAPVNVCYNSSRIRFGWVVPKAATQVNEIKVIVACVGKLSDGSAYELKTKPVVYNIADTLRLGSDVPQPDENWYLQFVTVMDEKVANALNSANNAAQSATQASESLSAVQQVQTAVNTSKETVQALAQQIQDNTTKAQASADAAKISEQNAQEWFEKTKEHSGVSYASKELAGIVSPQDVYVNPENGKMELTKQTTDATLYNSYAGGIKVNYIDGKSEQFSTTGAQLFDKDNATYVQNLSTNGVTFVAFNGTRMYYIAAKPNTTYTYSKTIGSVCRICSCSEIPAVGGEVNVHILATQNVATITTGENDNYIAIYPLTSSETSTISWDDVLNSVMINKGNTALPWEPYTGGVAAPNPDYPQEIKSVEIGKITISDGNGSESTVTISNPIILRGIGDVKDRIVRKDGTLQIERNITQYVFKGTESLYKGSSSDTLQNFIFNVSPFSKGDIMCNYLPYDTSAVANATKEGVLNNASGSEGTAIYLRLKIDRIPTLEKLKTWLTELYNQGNPLTVQYKRLTPTYEPLPESEQVALHSLSSYDTVTYISCRSEVEPTIDVEYGTSKVGAYTLDAWNKAESNRIKIEEVTSAMLALNQEQKG